MQHHLTLERDTDDIGIDVAARRPTVVRVDQWARTMAARTIRARRTYARVAGCYLTGLWEHTSADYAIDPDVDYAGDIAVKLNDRRVLTVQVAVSVDRSELTVDVRQHARIGGLRLGNLLFHGGDGDEGGKPRATRIARQAAERALPVDGRDLHDLLLKTVASATVVEWWDATTGDQLESDVLPGVLRTYYRQAITR